jgi:hypothetical protein
MIQPIIGMSAPFQHGTRIYAIEQLACGHPGQRSYPETIQQRLAHGQRRRCRHCAAARQRPAAARQPPPEEARRCCCHQQGEGHRCPTAWELITAAQHAYRQRQQPEVLAFRRAYTQHLQAAGLLSLAGEAWPDRCTITRVDDPRCPACVNAS